MDSTLGKRIVQNRKRLGMTQDKLAEQLGVTAQAVSKWENDQACPDITILPKLAEIFGVTTDELLGISPAEKVHTAEIIEEDPENAENSFHFQNGQFEFRWDSGRKGALMFAVLVLLVGVLTLLSRLMHWDASFWDILWPSALLVYGINYILPNFSVFALACTLFGGYFLLTNLGLLQFTLAGDLVFPIVLLLFGLGLLIDAFRKKKKPHFTFNRKRNHAGRSSQPESTFYTTDHAFTCTTSFGDDHREVIMDKLAAGEANVSFGDLTIDLTGCKEISEDCRIEANCSFGDLTFLVPKRWRVEQNTSGAFSSVEDEGHPDAQPEGVIHMECSASFGEISIKYV